MGGIRWLFVATLRRARVLQVDAESLHVSRPDGLARRMGLRSDRECKPLVWRHTRSQRSLQDARLPWFDQSRANTFGLVRASIFPANTRARPIWPRPDWSGPRRQGRDLRRTSRKGQRVCRGAGGRTGSESREEGRDPRVPGRVLSDQSSDRSIRDQSERLPGVLWRGFLPEKDKTIVEPIETVSDALSLIQLNASLTVSIGSTIVLSFPGRKPRQRTPGSRSDWSRILRSEDWSESTRPGTRGSRPSSRDSDPVRPPAPRQTRCPFREVRRRSRPCRRGPDQSGRGQMGRARVFAGKIEARTRPNVFARD